MKKFFIVANWKSNKNAREAKEWFQELQSLNLKGQNLEEKEVVICPSFPLLNYTQHNLQTLKLAWHVGSQNISPFKQGAFTGEVNAEQVSEFAEYAIIGHSERRQHFGETDEMLAEKVAMALLAGLKPIFCIQGKDTPVPDGVAIVAYEPVFAIGSGHPDTPEDAEEVAKAIKEKHSGVQYVLYGGSITPDNMRSFTALEHISGGLVGGASLDPQKFMKIIENA